MPSRIYGDPRRLGEEAVREELEKSFRILREAVNTSARLLEDSHRVAVERAEEEIRREYELAEERLRSFRARLEMDLRSRLARLKSDYVEEALRRLREAVRREKGGEWYEAYMLRVFRALREEAELHGGLRVRVAREDLEVARRIVPEVGGGLLELEEDPAEILGGAVAETPDGSTRIDYSLDLLLEEEEQRLRSVAEKALFGSQG